MLNANEKEKLVKLIQIVNFLVQYLGIMVKAANLLSTETLIETLQQTIQIEKKLNQIDSITSLQEKIE